MTAAAPSRTVGVVVGAGVGADAQRFNALRAHARAVPAEMRLQVGDRLQKVELDEVILLARHRVVAYRRLVLRLVPLADAGCLGRRGGRTRGLVDKAAFVPSLAVDGVAVP